MSELDLDAIEARVKAAKDPANPAGGFTLAVHAFDDIPALLAEVRGLYDDLNDALNHNDHTCEAVKRAERAEAAIERVKAEVHEWQRSYRLRPGGGDVDYEIAQTAVLRFAGMILAALDQPAAKEGKEDPSSPEAAS